MFLFNLLDEISNNLILFLINYSSEGKGKSFFSPLILKSVQISRFSIGSPEFAIYDNLFYSGNLDFDTNYFCYKLFRQTL